MPPHDPFEDLARYYDPIMEHVDYARWFDMTTMLAEQLLPHEVCCLDAACGTGTLLEMFKTYQWEVYGFDLSRGMLHTARKLHPDIPVFQGDLRALPCEGRFDVITCLFDSINFLLEKADVYQALSAFYTALKPGGMLYFDMVTERMVTRHFDGQEWTEENGGFVTRWSSSFDKETALAATGVRVNSMKEAVIQERIFEQDVFEQGLAAAGFTLLAARDVRTWKKPARRTTRIDYVALKQPSSQQRRAYQRLEPVLLEYHRSLH